MSAYLHNIDPFALQFTETFGIRWYGLSYLAGFFAGYLSIRWMLKRKATPFPPALLMDFVFIVAVGCVMGGRLGYCFFYRPELLFEITPSFPFWGALSLHEGGMASHGGMIGMVVACLWFGWRNKLPYLHLMDLTVLGATIGIFFGRIANFINGELVGRACNGRCIWPVQFPQDILAWPSYEPERLRSLEKVVTEVGVSSSEWLSWIAYGSYRSVSETLHRLISTLNNGESPAIEAAFREILTERHPSQLYAAVLEGGGIFLLLFFLWRKPLKPGVIVGAFFFIYAIGRIIGEQFRRPDLHLGLQAYGFSRGQWLSLILFLLASIALFYIFKRESDKIGGWGSANNE